MHQQLFRFQQGFDVLPPGPRCDGLILPVFDLKCIILYPAKYIDTTLRFKELPLSFCSTIAFTSLAESGLFPTCGSMDRELLGSRPIVTGSPALRCISIIHLLGSDRMYVDLPVNCILRTSVLLPDIEPNYDILEIHSRKHNDKDSYSTIFNIL